MISDLLHNLRLADVVDVLILSTGLYAILVWLREWSSRALLASVSLLAIVYFLARVLELYLTLILFHATFAMLLVLLVVVFQQEFRRALERLANWGAAPRRVRQAGVRDADVLAEALFALAGRRHGGLLVVAGREPLERHLQGGVPLDGRLSHWLVTSLFDPHSDGHDGAAVYRDGRLASFAMHLPTSENWGELAGRGTRHSAALGLSERSDALVVVVSEERGDVSAARDGKLRSVRSPAELKELLGRYLDDLQPAVAAPRYRRLWRYAGLKLLALALASLAWFLLVFDVEMVERTLTLPIEYRNIPSQLSLDPAPQEARVTLSGPERAFDQLDVPAMHIAVDLSDSRAGLRVVHLGPEQLRLPERLRVERYEPSALILSLRDERPPPEG